jgi:predicted ATPase
MWAVGIYQWRREMEAVHEQAEALMALSTEQGLPFPLAVGTMWQGWARAHQEEGEAGIRQVRQGLTHYQATGAVLFIPDYLGLLAEAYQQVGEAEEGLAVLTEALTVVDRTGEQVYAAELHRLKGTLTLQSKVRGPKSEVEEEAEACFQRTLAVARRQQAKSWELRAATSLARLWQQQGKTAEARELLAPVYSWFTEGFDTKDLQEAKALLEELTQ